jgi:putative flippase GtrA
MRQLLRYGLVGVISNLTIYIIYLLITHFGVEPKKAMTLVYILGASLGFIGNQKWTFAHRGNPASAVLRYVLAHFLGYLLNFMILFIFVDRLGYAHQWVQAVAIIIVAGFLFIVFKYFVFREKPLAN